MRKWNAILGIAIVILFFIHGIAGGFQLMGIMSGGSSALQILAFILLAVILAHTVIGIKLTADSLAACRKAGVSYFRENRVFWSVRITGLAILVLAAFHVFVFLGSNEGAYRLHYFGVCQLIVSILMVLCVAVHLIANIKPSMISFGIESLRTYAADILIVMAAVLFFAAVAFIIYYLRWAVI